MKSQRELPLKMLSAEGTTVDTSNVEAVAEKFYNNSVFVGDSIMAGFAGYASSSEAPEFLKKAVFLASVSYGVGDALKPAGVVWFILCIKVYLNL